MSDDLRPGEVLDFDRQRTPYDLRQLATRNFFYRPYCPGFIHGAVGRVDEAPPRPLPDWMTDPSLLPKRPPGCQ